MSRVRALATFAVLSVCGGASCLLSAVEIAPRATSGSGGSGGGTAAAGGAAATGGSGGSGGGGSCVRARWPDPPATNDPSTDDLEFVAAIRSVDLGESAPDLDSVGPKTGYDLDLYCTEEGDGSSCIAPSGVKASELQDGPGGIDNRAAKLFSAAKSFTSTIGSERYTASAEKGGWTILVRVSGYNGTLNDKNVQVAMFPSPGLHSLLCFPENETPKWDGTDVWPVDSSGLEKGAGPGEDGGTGPCGAGVPGYTFNKPKFYDPNAYVANGTLVANIPNSEIVFSSSSTGTVVKLTAGFITGQVTKGPNGYKLTKGVLTGRWKASDMFAAMSHVLENGSPICTDNAIYQAVKLAVCNARDIAATLGGPTTPCDAISIAIGFESEPAKIGLIRETAPLISNCPQATNPAFDTCPQ